MTCHAERQRSTCGDGWVGWLPGRRPAVPLPTTEVRDWFVVGRGTAGLCPGTRGPPNVFVMACRMLAPSAGLPDSSYTTRQRRPPARGGPTRDDRLWSGTSRPSIVGPPLAGGLRCRPVTGSQQTACYEISAARHLIAETGTIGCQMLRCAQHDIAVSSMRRRVIGRTRRLRGRRGTTVRIPSVERSKATCCRLLHSRP